MTTPANTERKARPVLTAAGIIAGLQALLVGLAATDVVSKDVLTIGTAVVAALAIALGLNVQSKTVPYEDAAAYVNQDGDMVAGPASDPQIVDGEVVDVVQVSGG